MGSSQEIASVGNPEVIEGSALVYTPLEPKNR